MPASDAAGGLRLVLFDLDDTFADTLPDLLAALNRVLEDAGRTALAPHALRPLVSGGGRAMIGRAFPDLDDAAALDRHRRRFLELYRENIARETRPFPGVERAVEAIEARGLRWGIVTNKLAWFTDALVAALPIARRAACVVSGDTAPRAKPFPDPLILACARAGERAHASVYVGDAASDVAAARAAAMPALVAGWGYIADGDDPHGWGADAVLDGPEALLGWIDARARGAGA